MAQIIQETAPGRRSGRARGIQPGIPPASPVSRALHKGTARVSAQVYGELAPQHPGLEWRPGLTGADMCAIAGLAPGEASKPIVGSQPDGGIFLYRCPVRGVRPLLTVEAKDQGPTGNAIERWFKNQAALKNLGPNLAYLTFCTGEGARPDGIMVRILNAALLEYATANREHTLRSWNRAYMSGPSFFRSPSGFSDLRLETVIRGILRMKLRDISRR